MRKILFEIAVVAFIASAVVLYATHVFADNEQESHIQRNSHNGGAFNPDSQLSQVACGKNLGDPVVDIVQKVQNDADSGVAGNYWAFDYYIRHIKVWATSAVHTYCAIVLYDGKFYTVPGQIGPGNIPPGALINTSTDDPVHGELTGGRRATITGTLLTTPAWPTHGSVGTTNYQCDINHNCPGIISWPGQYFNAGYTYNDDWWGWKYTAGSHGTWINAITGNSGNIL